MFCNYSSVFSHILDSFIFYLIFLYLYLHFTFYICLYIFVFSLSLVQNFIKSQVLNEERKALQTQHLLTHTLYIQLEVILLCYPLLLLAAVLHFMALYKLNPIES